MIFIEIKCHFNTCLGLVGGCIPCIPPCVRACKTTIQSNVFSGCCRVCKMANFYLKQLQVLFPMTLPQLDIPLAFLSPIKRNNCRESQLITRRHKVSTWPSGRAFRCIQNGEWLKCQASSPGWVDLWLCTGDYSDHVFSVIDVVTLTWLACLQTHHVTLRQRTIAWPVCVVSAV